MWSCLAHERNPGDRPTRLSGPHDSGAQVAAVARRIGEACEATGFFAVVGHGVPQETVAALRSAAYAFFDLPLEQKLQVKRPKPEQNRGYIMTGDETLARLAGNATPPDYKELFAIGPFDIDGSRYYTVPEAYPSFAPNLWPKRPSELAPALKSYWRAVEALANTIAEGFALALGLDADWFRPRIDRNTSQLRIMHYPVQQTPPIPGQLRAGEHTDLGMMTILCADNDVGGLQVRDRDGEWIDVPVFEDAFLVNLGDMMMRWTNDRWVSTPHRVINPPSEARNSRRLSIGYFFGPNYDASLACIDTCCSSEHPAKYKPVRATEYRTRCFAVPLVGSGYSAVGPHHPGR